MCVLPLSVFAAGNNSGSTYLLSLLLFHRQFDACTHVQCTSVDQHDNGTQHMYTYMAIHHTSHRTQLHTHNS